MTRTPVPTAVVVSLAVWAKRAADAETELAAYRAVMRGVEERKEDDAWAVVEALYGVTETSRARFHSVATFLATLALEDVLEAAKIARAAMPWSDPKRFKYFCGVCWRKIGNLKVAA